MLCRQLDPNKPYAVKCHHFCFGFDQHNYCPTCREAVMSDELARVRAQSASIHSLKNKLTQSKIEGGIIVKRKPIPLSMNLNYHWVTLTQGSLCSQTRSRNLSLLRMHSINLPRSSDLLTSYTPLLSSSSTAWL